MAARRRTTKKTTASAKVRRAKRGTRLQQIGDELGRAERALTAYARKERGAAGKIAGAGAAALGRIRRELHTGETATEVRRKLDELLRGKKIGFAFVRKPRS